MIEFQTPMRLGSTVPRNKTGGDGVLAKPSIISTRSRTESCVSGNLGFCQGENSNGTTFKIADCGIHQQKGATLSVRIASLAIEIGTYCLSRLQGKIFQA